MKSLRQQLEEHIEVRNIMEYDPRDIIERERYEMPHKFSYPESLIKLKGKKVTLVGKYNSDKTIFNVIGIIEK